MKLNKLVKSAKVELNNVRLKMLNNSTFISSHKEQEIVENIRSKGFYILENHFDKNWCEQAITEIDNLIEKFPDQIWKDAADSDFRLFGANRVSSFINEYYTHPLLISLLQTYEGTKMKDGFTLGAKLIAAENNKGSGGGWHRDHANVKQSKSIVYLTDVIDDNGPFQYISKSHKSYNIYKDSYNYNFDQFQNRFTEQEVNRLIEKEPERLKTITGAAGTVILTDTRGIHRGKPIQKGTRYALTNYLWAHSNVPKHIEKSLIKGK
ncbi:phytanoyl-CoA dioxygenase family protein [Christiangramia aquimixticola]|uniref:phytanoyl-CoA dioxygenase family protein n=1 Tax=Christiangramia aquimixticola TaxID=1697558 RepID=UPI003AA8D21B